MAIRPAGVGNEYRATVRWRRLESREEFLRGRFSRAHIWSFDGGITVAASASPHVVRFPYSSEEAVDPEEALVAAASSCHMLTFLYLASKAGFEVSEYDDEPVGIMTKNERGALWISEITLRPRVEYGAERPPSAEEERRLHERAHEECFIANSIRSEVRIARR